MGPGLPSEARCGGRECSHRDGQHSVRGLGRKVWGQVCVVPVKGAKGLVGADGITKSRGEGGPATYVEYGQSASLASLGILLAQGDEFLGQTLGLLSLVPCGGY